MEQDVQQRQSVQKFGRRIESRQIIKTAVYEPHYGNHILTV